MDVIAAVALSVIAVLLFYRWVERRHKVLVGRVVLGLLGLGGATAVLAWSASDRESERMTRLQRSVSVSYVPDSTAARRRAVDGVSADTVSGITFHICNSGDVRVRSVEFWPKTLRRGRSTEYDIVLQSPNGPYRSNQLSSDFILNPRTCVDVTWPGEFTLLDTVVAGTVLPNT